MLFVILGLEVGMARNVSVLDFGAVGDAKTLNTQALQRAIDACAETGGGIVNVPVGVYLTGTIYLRSHVELSLDRGAVIRGSLRIPEDYPVLALIYAEDIEDAGISGQGTVDGQSNDPYYERFELNDNKRPLGIFFNRCQHISVRDIHIINAGSWTLRFLGCDTVDVNGVTINSLKQGNNDGIDVDARNVTISNCRIFSDDDGICLKSDLSDFLPENITVTNCVIASNCNPIKLGTASCAGFKNVTFSNIAIHRTTESNEWDWSTEYRKVEPGTFTGLSGIAVECADGGVLENLSFTNIVMEGIITPIFVMLNHRSGDKGVIKDLQFSHITAKAEGIIPCLITGMADAHIQGVILRDIIVEHAGGEDVMTDRLPENKDGYPENRMFGKFNPAGGLYVRHADNVMVENLQVRQRSLDHRPAVVLDDVNDFSLRGLKTANMDAREMVQAIESTNVKIEK